MKVVVTVLTAVPPEPTRGHMVAFAINPCRAPSLAFRIILACALAEGLAQVLEREYAVLDVESLLFDNIAFFLKKEACI
jgi:hypothetical protein